MSIVSFTSTNDSIIEQIINRKFNRNEILKDSFCVIFKIYYQYIKTTSIGLLKIIKYKGTKMEFKKKIQINYDNLMNKKIAKMSILCIIYYGSDWSE